MLRKTKSASMSWSIIGPTTQNTPLMRLRVGPTLGISTVEALVLEQCWANVSSPAPTMKCCQQLQHLPNCGPTIACY